MHRDLENVVEKWRTRLKVNKGLDNHGARQLPLPNTLFEYSYCQNYRYIMDSLPPLVPQDVSEPIPLMPNTLNLKQSYTLWYTPSNSHLPPTSFHQDSSNTTVNAAHHHQLLRRQHPLHRTPLAKLRLDEEYLERRKENIRNFGNSWIKPPGIPKTLHQQREEQREAEEQIETTRREEQQAAMLLEAEREAAMIAAEIAAEGGEEGGEGEGEGERDLDDEVPDADATGLDVDDDDEDDDEEEEEEEEDEGEGEVPRGVLAPRMPEAAFREALMRGEEPHGGTFGENEDEEDPSQMLQEEDLLPSQLAPSQDMDMDMGVDLDADVPDADEEYEHTDTEDELTSSEAGSPIGHFGNTSLPRQIAAASSMVRSDGTQNSLEFGIGGAGVMSLGSSQVGSSPQPGFGGGRRSGHEMPRLRRGNLPREY